jgi:hypothetical protein
MNGLLADWTDQTARLLNFFACQHKKQAIFGDSSPNCADGLADAPKRYGSLFNQERSLAFLPCVNLLLLLLRQPEKASKPKK